MRESELNALQESVKKALPFVRVSLRLPGGEAASSSKVGAKVLKAQLLSWEIDDDSGSNVLFVTDLRRSVLAMSPFGGRSRLAAALVAALAMVAAPLLVTVPVRAAPIDCSVTFSLVVLGDLVIGPGVPGAPETDHRSVAFRGSTPSSDPCPGDGYFDSSQIEETHGSVTLADVEGETSGTSATIQLSRPPSNTVEGTVLINRNRYKDPSVLGRAVFTLWVSDGNDHWISATYSFYVRREVRFTTLNAGPEPVRKGSLITVTGHLARLDYDRSGQARWIPYAGKSVDVYRRLKGTSWIRFHAVASAATTSTGYFSKKLVARADSCYSAFSPETDHYARKFASKWGDCVDVQ